MDTKNITEQLATLARVKNYCRNTNSGRGIWKRIDENRELLLFLQMRAPEILARFPWIEGWLAGQDVFLVDLLKLLGLSDKPVPAVGVDFPRPWPGSTIDNWYGDYKLGCLQEKKEGATRSKSLRCLFQGYGKKLKRILKTSLLLAFLPGIFPAAAEADILDGPCEKYGVPKALVVAIARQESRGHPWAVNIGGRSYFPASREEALALISRQGRGRSYDLGLMQVNSQWLRRLKISPAVALEPANNVYLGVWILAHEVRRYGLNWRAVGAYHSPSPARQIRYARAVAKHYTQIKTKEQPQ